METLSTLKPTAKGNGWRNSTRPCGTVPNLSPLSHGLWVKFPHGSVETLPPRSPQLTGFGWRGFHMAVWKPFLSWRPQLTGFGWRSFHTAVWRATHPIATELWMGVESFHTAVWKLSTQAHSLLALGVEKFPHGRVERFPPSKPTAHWAMGQWRFPHGRVETFHPEAHNSAGFGWRRFPHGRVET